MKETAANTNVVSLNIDTVYTMIKSFLDDKALRAQNTASSYETDIRQFFKIMRNKEVEYLTFDDLVFKHTDVVRYRMTLVSSEYSNSTINHKISCMYTLYKFLERDYPNLRSAIFRVDRLKEKQNSYGVVTVDEARTMIDLVKKQYKGAEKALLIEMAMRTSFRKEALLTMCWSDIVWNSKHGYWVVSVYDKGEKLDEKPISNDFYQRLLTLNGTSNKNDNQVFHLDAKTPNSMMNILCEEMEIPKERNIKFHSLKKTTINWALDSGMDITVAARQGNHSSIQTTWKHYVDKNKDMSNMPGLKMDEEIDMSVLSSLSQDQLIRIISESSILVKTELIAKAKTLR